ncbi:PREDICTED: cytochrome c oxidase subunit 7A-related protein, mitochondrial-like [Priapulus caudatus]|uniref:Cytochrome c oxidase subunit 7A-related protein, mitochondrial-like n=1 Tax=Priapulus caudatus TaxID=37621 RepID=A0ABM1ETV3_PRICU|nr:PREDICTED: cytochrome c oxidase subunit 7A-related protein, mitochondrial-like [Priapulus caudatus]
MFYKYFPGTNTFAATSQQAAYYPQGLRPLPTTELPTMIYESSKVKFSKASAVAAAKAPPTMASKPAPMSTAASKLDARVDVSKTAGNPRIKQLQELFTKPDGVPIHLKRGAVDRVLFSSTMVLCGICVAYTAYTIYDMAFPKKSQ